MTTLLIVAGLILLVLLPGACKIWFRWSINDAAFMAQIQKLVMANNIDRAINLCNAAPNALLTQGIKALLCRANKPVAEMARVHTSELLRWKAKWCDIPGPLFLWRWKQTKMFHRFAMDMDTLEVLLVRRATRPETSNWR